MGAAVCLKNKRNNILCASYNEQSLEKKQIPNQQVHQDSTM